MEKQREGKVVQDKNRYIRGKIRILETKGGIIRPTEIDDWDLSFM